MIKLAEEKSKYELALKAIMEMYEDMSVSKDDTIDNLTSLIDEIEMLIDAIS